MKYLLIITLSLTTLFVRANEPEVANNLSGLKGVIIDKTTGEALAGVKVTIEGTDLEVYTNFDGEFEFANVSAGNFKLHCSMVSYSELIINSADVLANNKSKSLRIKMAPVQSQPVNQESNYCSLG